MNYNLVLRDFYTEWETMGTMSTQKTPKLPTLSKTNTPLKEMV